MDEFETYRPLLFSIAYRMTGSASDAEDIVQDAYLRYRSAPTDDVRSLKSYLTTITTRLALDHLKSARVKREQYVGTWLPEPVLTAGDSLPAETVEQSESLSFAFLVLLEALTPPERAVFLLREVFDYGYDEIALILDKGPAACRQLFHRAQERLAARQKRFVAHRDTLRDLVVRFVVACQKGDVAQLTELLKRDVVIWSDGGGKAVAAARPLVGFDVVSRFFFGLIRTASADTAVALADVNGQPTLVGWEGGRLTTVFAFALVDGQIASIYGVRNPDKLAHLERQIQLFGSPLTPLFGSPPTTSPASH